MAHFVLLACLIIFMLDGLTFLWVRRVYGLVYHLFIHLSGYVALFDLDNLKEINDRFGHSMGDRVLRRIGLVLLVESRLRAFRYGGDEFVLLLPWFPNEKVEMLVKRIQKRVSEIDIDGVRINVSVGIGRNEEVADKNLYKAKVIKPR